MLLLSGGISVGDYDFVRPSLLHNGVEEVFYKVNQKPGKPLFFGKSDSKLVFALPGNPAAALNCFYMYVYGAIQSFKGQEHSGLQIKQFPLSNNHVKKEGRAEFVKVKLEEDQIHILEGQGSDVLQSFSMADGLAYFSAGESVIQAGEMVPVYLLP